MSSLSHELRTPLNAIVGLNHILEESELSDRQKEIVSKIQSSSDHLTSLLNDILDFSMLKSEKLTLNPSRFRLKDFWTTLPRNMYRRQIPRDRLLTDYQFDPDLCLRLDPVRLEQVLSNLLKKCAAIYRYRFIIRIHVHVLKEFSDTATLKFAVEDTGVGLRGEDLSDIFTEFHPAEGKPYQKRIRVQGWDFPSVAC